MNTPFVDFKAPEIEPEKQKYFFVEPDYLNKIISPKASLIFGERGSGKTTILKHLEKAFNKSRDLKYVGVYYRFETAYVKALNNPEMTVEQNICAFSQSIAAIMGKLICQTLENIKTSRKIEYDLEKEICFRTMETINVDTKQTIDTFEKLANVLEIIRKKTLINLQNGLSICYMEYTNFLSELCTELKKESIFSKTCFCVLFDEYENLTCSQQRVVNSYIKGSTYFLTFKVCMRPQGFMTKETVAEREQLISGHDYEEFDYVKDIVGSDKEIRAHFRKICSNRLKYFYSKQKVEYQDEDLEIDRYLQIIKDEDDIESWERIDEYKEAIRQKLLQLFPEQKKQIYKVNTAIDLKLIMLLCEKKYSGKEIFSNLEKKTEKYNNWIHNYRQNIIFQIVSECEQTRKYCGFDTFAKLSNGNTRRMLEILHYAFGDYEQKGMIYDKISVKRQTDAVNKVSEAFFDQIDYIPVNGYKAKYLTNALGSLFANCILDKRAKKFEANSFSILTTTMLDAKMVDELKAVLRDCVIWGVLIPSKANKVKKSGDIVFDGKDYMLHPIFAPYFKISYRKRQKCELKDIDVYAMLKPNSRSEIKNIAKELNNDYVQQELEFT